MEIPQNAEHLDELYNYGLKLLDSLAQDVEETRLRAENLSYQLSEAQSRQRQIHEKLSELLSESSF